MSARAWVTAIAVVAGCAVHAPAPGPMLSNRATGDGVSRIADPDALLTEPAAATPILDRLNAWCASSRDCVVAEQPDAFPGQVPSGETRGWIDAQRDQLARLGVTVVWDASRGGFVSQVEADLRVMIGGNFAPDHLGPEVYGATLARARAHADLYLGTLVERVIGPSPSPARLLADLPATVIALLAPSAPFTAARAAARLRRVYLAALVADPARSAPLRGRIAALDALRF